MALRQILTAAVVSTALASCASAPPVSSGPQPENRSGTTIYPAVKRWTGKLSPTQSYSAAAVASQRQNAYGSVELTVSANNPTLTRVVLTVSVPMGFGLETLGWGLSQGNCGSGNPPVLSPSSFPTIQINANGQGKVDTSIPFVLPESGNYHVNVFRGSGAQLTDVITCASLRRQS